MEKNKKEISLREYIDMPYLYHHVRYINQDIDFVENSAELLDNTIRSYIELFNNKKNFQLKKLQLKFTDFIFSRLKKLYFEVIEDKKKVVNQQDIIIIFKQLSLLKFIEGSFELNFLKKNFFV